MLPVQQHDVEILGVRKRAQLVEFLLWIHAIVESGHLGHELVALARYALQSDAQHLVHLTVGFGGLEEANAAVVRVTHQPREPVLSEIALHLPTEASCSKRQPRNFHPGSAQHYVVGGRRRFCEEWKSSGDGNRSGGKSSFQEFTSGEM